MKKNILIINALIWAGVILIVSYLSKGMENQTMLMGVLAVGFTLQNGFTYNALRKKE